MSGIVLSVVVPAFNEQAELPALLRSLQTARDTGECEIIVADNGSTDDTGAVAASFGVATVKLPRSTVAAARNAGVQRAVGRVIAFIDADIVVTQSWIDEALRLARDVTWTNQITGDVCDVGVNPSWLENSWFGPMYRRGASKYLNSGNLLVTRADFLAVGGFSAALVTGEDVDFCVRAIDRGIVVVARRTLHVYHNGYPRTLRAFFRREAWHGRGDFSSWSIFFKSRVAQLAVIVAALHALAVYGALTARPLVSVGSVTAIVAICLGSSVWKWRRESPQLWLKNGAVFYFYFVGRAWAAVRQFRGGN